MQRDWGAAAFRAAYVADGGSVASSRSYVSYLNRADRVLGGLLTEQGSELADDLLGRAERLPVHAWGGERERRNSLSALRSFVRLQSVANSRLFPVLLDDVHHVPVDKHISEYVVRQDQNERATTSNVRAHTSITAPDFKSTAVLGLLAEAQRLGADYYQLTGKPLGVTGEVAEFEAARLLGLNLCLARTPGHDAIDPRSGERVQIKGRAVDAGHRYRGMCPAIRTESEVDAVVLVLLDRRTLTALEVWQASVASVRARVAGLTSERRRGNGTLAISQFRSIAVQVA